MAKRVIQSRKAKPKSPNSRKRKVKSNAALRIVLGCMFILFVFSGIYLAVKSLFPNEPKTFESKEYYVKGIDLSHHNPIINWQIAAEENITFAYIKATEGSTHEDRNYPYNYDLASKTNVHVGSYHFYSFGVSGKEQAKHFIRVAKCKSGDMIPAIDIEHSAANPYSKDKDYIANVISELKILANELYEHYGVNPVIYTNRDCYKLYIDGNFPDNLIWMSDLDGEPSEKIENWRIWQFTHKGKFPGVKDNVDLNYYRYSYAEFEELLLP